MTKQEEVLVHFARAILEAQAIHDASWDGSIHRIKHYKAAEEALKRQGLDVQWAAIAAWLNTLVWNDVQIWASGVLSK
jgi:hypothetical protein